VKRIIPLAFFRKLSTPLLQHRLEGLEKEIEAGAPGMFRSMEMADVIRTILKERASWQPAPPKS